MRISEVLRVKGSDVATIAPTATVAELLAGLAARNVGAMVVVQDGELVGIVSERDVVRQANERGAAVLEAPVAEIMTADVATCTPDETVDHLTVLMTERRIRHVPVVQRGQLYGIVSIGDVVKNRMDELERAQSQLEAYIAQG
jgi:CBS domain-containing protein